MGGGRLGTHGIDWDIRKYIIEYLLYNAMRGQVQQLLIWANIHRLVSIQLLKHGAIYTTLSRCQRWNDQSWMNSTTSSSGPLSKTKSRINGLLSPIFPFRFPSLWAEGEGRWPGKYCLAEYGLYRLVARSFTELKLAVCLSLCFFLRQ
jgi:hypothetical protein